MRVRLTDGTREVDITAKGSDPALLRQAERTARRLLDAMQTEPSTSRGAFGFGRHLDGVALDSATERADQDDEPDLDEQLDQDDDG
ncbi:hypothetical protein ABT390_36645 [Streptomyces aurantiacus]|uniref:hypothetical protein n=1 Tax=Streptomyces aurantiacus TaxID=47760 RepID=UPI0033241104